jgi:uncharacterized protein YbbC (DUF1343 family)
VDFRLRSTIDILAANTDLRALFGPEHGVRGDFAAGDHVADWIDARTGIPVYSLYGSSRRPDPASLSLVDVIVYDIQDLGVRSYTYISTLGMVMEVAAQENKELVVLDRPDPLGGLRVEGPLVRDGFKSFVSRYEIPYVYGLTCGELALLLNGEGLLEGGVRCDLQVIPMSGWKRKMTFRETGLQWIPTSPHIPDIASAFCYPATGIIGELDGGMIGIGYTLPFQTLLAPDVDAQQLADSMNALGLPGLRFRPVHLKPYYGSREGEALQGVQVHLEDPRSAPLTPTQFLFIQEAHRINPDFNPFTGKEDRYRSFDIVCGSDRVRKLFTEHLDYGAIRDYWEGDAGAFRKRSQKYYLYQPEE